MNTSLQLSKAVFIGGTSDPISSLSLLLIMGLFWNRFHMLVKSRDTPGL